MRQLLTHALHSAKVINLPSHNAKSFKCKCITEKGEKRLTYLVYWPSYPSLWFKLDSRSRCLTLLDRSFLGSSFFSSLLSAFVRLFLVLLASFSFLLPVFFSSLSLLLCSAFLFLKAGVEMDEDNRCWSFCAQPMVAASRDRESDGHAGFGLSSFSLLLLMLSLEMTKMMACCAGGVLALASVFSLLSTVSFLWFSLPCLPLVSSCLSFLVFPALSLAPAPPLYLLQNSSFLLLLSLFSSFFCSLLSLQDLTVLLTEFFRRRKTHIPSVINLPTESPTEMLRRWIFRR